MPGGAEFPPRTAVQISSQAAWDQQRVEVSPRGEFELSGVLAGQYTLCVNDYADDASSQWKYHLSRRNRSRSPLWPDCLIGRVDEDLTLMLVLDRGQWKPAQHSYNWKQETHRRLAASPLVGATDVSPGEITPDK
jgi:hypothetical protein